MGRQLPALDVIQNDATVLGEQGSRLCDNSIKAVVLESMKMQGGLNSSPNLCDVSYGRPYNSNALILLLIVPSMFLPFGPTLSTPFILHLT